MIKYSKLLDPIFIFYCKNNPDLKIRGWNDWIPPDNEEIEKRIRDYKRKWSEYEKQIMEGMCEVLGLKFRRNTIDVYIVSGNPRQLSDPIVIKSGFKADQFVDSLAHELIHKLFEDNAKKFPISILEEMFPKETVTARNHIVTYSVLKYIYLDILKDNSRLERDIKNATKHATEDYSRAWKLVEEGGYIELIKKLKSRLK